MATHEIKPVNIINGQPDQMTLSRLSLAVDFGAVIVRKPPSITQVNIDEMRAFASRDIPYTITSMRERRFFNVAAMQNGSTDPTLQSIPHSLKELLYQRTKELSDSTGIDYSKWKLHFNQANTLFIDWHFDDRISLQCVVQLPGDRKLRYLQPSGSERLTVRNYAARGLVQTRNQDVRDLVSNRPLEEICRLDELDSVFFNPHFLHASGTEPIGMTIAISAG